MVHNMNMTVSYLLLVLQTVSPALHVHLLGVGVVEAAVAELAVEGERLAVVGAHLLDVVLAHGLHVRLVGLLGLGRLCRVTSAHRAQPAGRYERDLRRARDRLFS